MKHTYCNSENIERLTRNLDMKVNLDRVLFYKLIDTIYHSQINVFQLHLIIKQSVSKRKKYNGLA